MARNDYPPEFEAFWAAYPRQVAKKAAFKSWGRAIREGADPEEIIEGALMYADNADPQYLCLPTTWLNQGRWEDNPQAYRKAAPDRQNYPSSDEIGRRDAERLKTLFGDRNGTQSSH